jgi:hypothetical protein
MYASQTYGQTTRPGFPCTQHFPNTLIISLIIEFLSPEKTKDSS